MTDIEEITLGLRQFNEERDWDLFLFQSTPPPPRLFHPFKVKLILPPSLAELVVGVRIRIDIQVVDWEPPVCADDARG